MQHLRQRGGPIGIEILEVVPDAVIAAPQSAALAVLHEPVRHRSATLTARFGGPNDRRAEHELKRRFRVVRRSCGVSA